MNVNREAIDVVMCEYKDLFQQFTDLDKILLCLKTKGVIQKDEYEELVQDVTGKKRRQADFLLKKIPEGKDDAFLNFLRCLLEHEYKDHIEKLLKSMESKDQAFAAFLRNRKCY